MEIEYLAKEPWERLSVCKHARWLALGTSAHTQQTVQSDWIVVDNEVASIHVQSKMWLGP